MKTDCPLCGAPAPVVGAIEHARDCKLSPEPKEFPDWYSHGESKPTPRPAPPLTAEDAKAELLRIALECERAWGAMKATKAKAAGV
jgi:hypothetical protein